jgi:cytidylate kinase
MDGEDVSEAIRTPEVDKKVSRVSVVPQVRQKLVAEQRRIAAGRKVVCEGRDIGSVVFPHADVKFYVDASVQARAGRRRQELDEKGVAVSVKHIEDNLTERDYIDSTRSHSPLTRVKDAIYIDTSNITIKEEVMIVVNLVRMRMKGK